jgi:phosphate transport system substrate-binding protein
MKPMKTFVLMLASVTLLLIACNSGSNNGSRDADGKLKGKITISGAFALYPMAVKWAEEFEKIHPRVKINISAGGAGKGMADALSQMVDLGMFSKEVSPEEQAKGAWWVGVAKDAVLPTINANNPSIAQIRASGMTKDELFEIFITGKTKTWGQAVHSKSMESIEVFTRSDACGAADMWAKFLNNKKQEDLQGIGVNGDPGLADALRKNSNAIGYNNLNFVYDIETHQKYPGLDVIPLDLNANGKIDSAENFYQTLEGVTEAIKSGQYPSPPARELYFVSKGKPTNPVILAFLNWVLTEGQKYVPEAGYVTLPPDVVAKQLEKLN